MFVHKVDAKCELNTVPFGQIGHRQECSVAVCQRGRQSRRQRVSSGRVGIHGAVVVDMQNVSIDAKKAGAVVDEIKAGGGEAIVVVGDVGADDFPQTIVEATVK